MLIIFAAGVARRKRVAWWILLAYFTLNLLRYAGLAATSSLLSGDFLGLARPRPLPGYTLPSIVIGVVTTVAILILLSGRTCLVTNQLELLISHERRSVRHFSCVVYRWLMCEGPCDGINQS